MRGGEMMSVRTRAARLRIWNCAVAATACALLLLLFAAPSRATQLDNGVAGVPQIQCGENSVTFSVRTQNLFRGNIYVKGQYGAAQCRQEYGTNDFNGASFSVRIGDCGMRRIRQLTPVGMNYQIVYVVNFHPQFVTKVDRAYNVRCFYAQADRTVTSQLDVSMLPTESLEQATVLAPNCEYSVRSSSLDGPTVRFTRVGDKLVHRWECDNPNFGMLVKNCFVGDGSGSQIRVLDSRGCPVFTPVIQSQLQYDAGLNLAYAEVWAYKFPDRAQLFFQCQIQVCNKRDNECLGVTPPNCPLVTKSTFSPSSSVDASGDPTRVIGNFGAGTGGVVNPGFSTDNTYGAGGQQSFGRPVGTAGTGLQPINPAVINRGNQPIGSSFNVDPSPGAGYGYRSGQYSSSIDQSSSSSSSYNAYGGSSSSNRGPSFGFQGQQGGGLQPARPYKKLRDEMKPDAHQPAADEANTDEQGRLRRRRSAIELARFVPAGTYARQRDEPVWLENELDAAAVSGDEPVPTDDWTETMDVIAPTLFVADGDDVDPNDPGLADLQQDRAEGGGRASARSRHALCMSAAGTVLVFATVALLLLAIGALLVYVAHLWRQHDRLLAKTGGGRQQPDGVSVGSGWSSPSTSSGGGHQQSALHRSLAFVLRDAWQRPQPASVRAKLAPVAGAKA